MQVWAFLRKIRKGFDRGGALAAHDNLLMVVSGHTDGQNIECAVDNAGQVSLMYVYSYVCMYVCILVSLYIHKRIKMRVRCRQV